MESNESLKEAISQDRLRLTAASTWPLELQLFNAGVSKDGVKHAVECISSIFLNPYFQFHKTPLLRSVNVNACVHKTLFVRRHNEKLSVLLGSESEGAVHLCGAEILHTHTHIYRRRWGFKAALVSKISMFLKDRKFQIVQKWAAESWSGWAVVAYAGWRPL